MKLSIVIVSYNVRRYLDQCLESVQKAVEGIDGTEVFVVDNASPDDTLTVLPDKYPWVHFIANEENLGFARANNSAIRQSTGEYVLLLNPDTTVAEHTLCEAVSFMDAHPQAGGAGVMMHNEDGTLAPESRRVHPSILHEPPALGRTQPYRSHQRSLLPATPQGARCRRIARRGFLHVR